MLIWKQNKLFKNKLAERLGRKRRAAGFHKIHEEKIRNKDRRQSSC